MMRGGTSRRHRPAVSTVEKAQTWCRSSSDPLWVKQPHTDKLIIKTQASTTLPHYSCYHSMNEHYASDNSSENITHVYGGNKKKKKIKKMKRENERIEREKIEINKRKTKVRKNKLNKLINKLI